jgi:XTP/dITP diphosphohydrolase
VSTSDDTVLIATRSPGKLRELRPLFAVHGLAATDIAEAGLVERPEEDSLEAFDTFEANAIAKAEYFMTLSGGRPTVADDSGLEVSALDGRPGVLSKRWSGRADLSGLALDAANNAKLMDELRALGARGVTDRRARYVCVAAYSDNRGVVIRRGHVDGRIVDVPRGDGGFGYDPYFESDEVGGKTFGEVGIAEKENVSHRGRAFRALIPIIASRVLG